MVRMYRGIFVRLVKINPAAAAIRVPVAQYNASEYDALRLTSSVTAAITSAKLAFADAPANNIL